MKLSLARRTRICSQPNMPFGFELKALKRIKLMSSPQSQESESVNSQSFISLSERKSGRHPLLIFEELWRDISQASLQGSELCLEIESQKRKRTQCRKAALVCLREFAETEAQAFRFTGLLTTLRIVTQNLRKGTVTTLRDIYYNDVSAYKGNQCRLNDSLQSISRSLGLSLERDLAIFPSPKGLVYGGPQICLQQGEEINLYLEYTKENILVPPSINLKPFRSNCILDAIVIMEKEAVFKSFAEHLENLQTARNIVLLTGKGNPDQASVRFLQALRRSTANTPVLIFVDSDVYGLRILWTYILAAGGHATNILFAGTFLLEHDCGYLTIASKEWKLLMNMLQEVSDYAQNSQCATEIIRIMKRELTRGMLLGIKAELNVICASSCDDGLNSYIWKKVAREVCDKT